LFPKERSANSQKREKEIPHEIVLGTYDSWIERQEKSYAPKRKAKSATDLWGMPHDTLEEWLEKQKAVEKETKEEVTPPLGTTEKWLRKQVADRLMQEIPLI
jgi:hypothetical protein